MCKAHELINISIASLRARASQGQSHLLIQSSIQCNSSHGLLHPEESSSMPLATIRQSLQSTKQAFRSRAQPGKNDHATQVTSQS